MTKQEFLHRLGKRLSALPEEEVNERLHFYSEMIDDRTEDGLSEEEAVAQIGSCEEIAAQILAELPTTQRVAPKRRLQGLEVTLLALGSPIWLSLAISLVAVIFSVCVSLWVVPICLAACSLGGVTAGIAIAINESGPIGLALIGLSLVCAGASILAFWGCKLATKGLVVLAKKLAARLKKCTIKKEGEQ